MRWSGYACSDDPAWPKSPVDQGCVPQEMPPRDQYTSMGDLFGCMLVEYDERARSVEASLQKALCWEGFVLG